MTPRIASLILCLLLPPAGAAAAGLPGDYWEGKRLYGEVCFSCHGHRGDGRGPNWKSTLPRPQAFTSPSMRRMADDYLFAVTKFGKLRVLKEQMGGFRLRGAKPSAMPGFADSVGDAEIRALLRWVRGFASGKPPDDPESRELYEAACAECHGKAGKGDGPAALGSQPPGWPFVSAIQPPPTDLTSREQMARFDDAYLFWLVKLGRIGATEERGYGFMEPFGHILTDAQIRGIVRYIREAFIEGRPRGR
ncbi:MAG: c-type cytochrome [Nitrospinota bacterium]